MLRVAGITADGHAMPEAIPASAEAPVAPAAEPSIEVDALPADIIADTNAGAVADPV